MPFPAPELPTDADEVGLRILTNLRTLLPGWEATEGAPEVALAEEIGREAVVLNQDMIAILQLAIAGIGETAFGFPAYQGVPAEIEVEFTLISAGLVIPAGFTVTGVNPAGEDIAFQLLTDVGVPGTTATVTMTAADVGDAGNGVPAGPLQVVTGTTAVASAEALSASVNGADPETIDLYLDRLIDYLGTLRPGGVNGRDLAALARSVPGVDRALGVDLYNPADPGTDYERTVTVFPVDEENKPVPTPVAEQLQAVLEDAREVNFIVHVEDPQYTAVDIEYDVVAEEGASPVAVEAEILLALSTWLLEWGTTSTDKQAWIANNTVRLLDVVKVIGNVTGVAYINSVTINGSAGDLALPGVAALPAPLDDPIDPSTIDGTVT